MHRGVLESAGISLAYLRKGLNDVPRRLGPPFRMLTKVFSLAALMVFSANAATYSSLGTADDVRKKISSARDGDTVTIPIGSFTWARGVGISKGITLQGPGEGITSIKNISGGVLISVSSGRGPVLALPD